MRESETESLRSQNSAKSRTKNLKIKGEKLKPLMREGSNLKDVLQIQTVLWEVHLEKMKVMVVEEKGLVERVKLRHLLLIQLLLYLMVSIDWWSTEGREENEMMIGLD